MTTMLATIDIVLRIAATVQLGVLAVLLLRSRRDDHLALTGFLFCASLIAFVVSSAPGATAWLGWSIVGLSAICVTKSVLLWMSCTALFADRFRISGLHVCCLAAMAGLGVWHDVAVQPGVTEQGHWPAVASTLLLDGASLVFVILAPLALFLGHRLDLDERRRHLRLRLAPAVSLYLAAVIGWQAVAFFFGRVTPPLLVAANLALIFGAALLACLTFVKIRFVNWLDQPSPAPRPGSLSYAEAKVLQRLKQRFAVERLYAREGLTIVALAATLATQEHVLRRAINQGLGFRNFNDFLHDHRLREAARRLRDPGEARLPVLSIALDVGYGSIGPFNRAFKTRFGMTPTEYRRGPPEAAPPVRPVTAPVAR